MNSASAAEEDGLQETYPEMNYKTQIWTRFDKIYRFTFRLGSTKYFDSNSGLNYGYGLDATKDFSLGSGASSNSRLVR